MEFNIIFVSVLLVFKCIESKGGAADQFILFTEIDVDLLYNIEKKTWTSGREYQKLSSVSICELIKSFPQFFYTPSSVTLDFIDSLLRSPSEDYVPVVRAQSNKGSASTEQLQIKDNTIVQLNIPPPEKYEERKVMRVDAVTCNWNNFIVYLARNKNFLNSESYFMFLQGNGERLGNKPDPLGVVMKFNSVHKINDGSVRSFYEVFTKKEFRRDDNKRKLLETEKEKETSCSTKTVTLLELLIENACTCISFFQRYSHIIHDENKKHNVLYVNYEVKSYMKEPDSTKWCWFNKKINAVAEVQQCTVYTKSREKIIYNLVKHPEKQDVVYYVSDITTLLKDTSILYDADMIPYRLSSREN